MSIKSIQKALDYQRIIKQENLQYFKANHRIKQKTFASEITSSLQSTSKFISPKYFYDEIGSKLFDEICGLPEYYLYNCESSILKNISKDLKAYITSNIRLVELGSGSSTKTRLLIDALLQFQKRVEYFPIDISNVLIDSTKDLYDHYNNLEITGIIDTYENGLDFIEHYDDKPNLITFLGSSFGNFSQDEGMKFLKKISNLMKPDDLFLIGLDLKKDPTILHNAYNDNQNITAKFNLNILKRINEELDGNFILDDFEHHAIYDEEKGRVEMYLRSLSDQTVKIQKADLDISFSKDELIHTENSHKFSISQIESVLRESNFEKLEIWFDSQKYFSLVLAKKL